MPEYNNAFRAPDHLEEMIVDKNGGVIGTIRIKPSGVLWKPKGQQKFFRVSLNTFKEWIIDSKTGAKRVKQ